MYRRRDEDTGFRETPPDAAPAKDAEAPPPASPPSTDEVTSDQEREAQALLAQPPRKENLRELVGANRARRRLPPLTTLLVAALLIMLGFCTGVQVQQAVTSLGPPPATSGSTPTPASTGAVTGVIEAVDGATVYVRDGQGGITTVTTGAHTAVHHSVEGAVEDLRPGTAVVVEGAPGDDGVISASSITAEPAD